MSDGEKMTAKERAEKIHHMCFEDFHGNTRTELVSRITAEIAEAEREAVIHEFEGEDCTVAKLQHEAYVMGYKAATKAISTEWRRITPSSCQWAFLLKPAEKNYDV